MLAALVHGHAHSAVNIKELVGIRYDPYTLKKKTFREILQFDLYRNGSSGPSIRQIKVEVKAKVKSQVFHTPLFLQA